MEAVNNARENATRNVLQKLSGERVTVQHGRGHIEGTLQLRTLGYVVVTQNAFVQFVDSDVSMIIGNVIYLYR